MLDVDRLKAQLGKNAQQRQVRGLADGATKIDVSMEQSPWSNVDVQGAPALKLHTDHIIENANEIYMLLVRMGIISTMRTL